MVNLKEDHSRLTATYLSTHDCSQAQDGKRNQNLSWAKKNLRDFDRSLRRITRLYDFYLDDNGHVHAIRRTIANKKR